MKQREFNYITREAQEKASKLKESCKFDDKEFYQCRNEMVKEAVSLNVKELVECTNASGYQDQIVEGIVDGLAKSHRYLQGEFMMALGKALVEYGKISTDARNQAGVEMSARMGIVATAY